MSSENRRTILVVGATGAQGGSVVRHLLERGHFAVRALTRDPGSERSEALRRSGVEVVVGDLSDPERVRAAVDGCYGVFGVTSFFEHFEKEYEHGRNLIDAVEAAGVEHFVFSSLPHIHHLTGGELEVPHSDLKGRLEEYARERGLPATFVHVAFYYENFLAFFPPQRQEDGSYQFGFPQGDVPLSMVSVEDVGGVVASIFERREESLGRTVGIVGDDRPAAEYAEEMSRALGKRIVYRHVPRELFATFFDGAAGIANMFDYNRRFLLDRRAEQEESRELHPGILSFEPWLRENASRFEPVLNG